MLGEIRTKTWRILHDVPVDSLLITCLVPDAITVLCRARKRSPHESPGGEQLDDMSPHVSLVRDNQIRPNERRHFVSDHLCKPLITTTDKLSTQTWIPFKWVRTFAASAEPPASPEDRSN